MNELVKLKNIKSGHVAEFNFEHALAILRNGKKENRNTFEAVGNHQFIENELIIKPSNTDSTETPKRGKGTKRVKVRK